MTGGIIALDRPQIVENADDPAVPAGYVIAAAAARRGTDPLASVLKAVGLRQTMGPFDDWEPAGRRVGRLRPQPDRGRSNVCK